MVQVENLLRRASVRNRNPYPPQTQFFNNANISIGVKSEQKEVKREQTMPLAICVSSCFPLDVK